MERGKMKLSKTAWWILGIGFFIIASAVLVMLLSRQSGDARQLEDNLSVTQNLLTKLISEKEDLDSQFAQLENQLDEAESSSISGKAKFSKAVMSIEYDEEIFSIANDCNLEIMSLTSSEPRDVAVAEITYDTTRFEAEVRGNVADILSFINDIVMGGYFTTATVELVNLEVPEPGKGESPSAVIKIIIYSYEGE